GPMEAIMAMKTILVPTENHAAMRSALETALLLAKRCDSYIEGFALQFGINEFSAIDMDGGLCLETFEQESQEEPAEARKLFAGFMAENKVPRANGEAPAPSFGWLADAPEGESFVGSYGRVLDIIVLSRPDANTTGLHNKSVESGLFESGRPILI